MSSPEAITAIVLVPVIREVLCAILSIPFAKPLTIVISALLIFFIIYSQHNFP